MAWTKKQPETNSFAWYWGTEFTEDSHGDDPQVLVVAIDHSGYAWAPADPNEHRTDKLKGWWWPVRVPNKVPPDFHKQKEG